MPSLREQQQRGAVRHDGDDGRVSWAAQGPAWDEACAQCAAAVIGTEWTSASFQVSPWRR